MPQQIYPKHFSIDGKKKCEKKSQEYHPNDNTTLSKLSLTKTMLKMLLNKCAWSAFDLSVIPKGTQTFMSDLNARTHMSTYIDD